MAAMNNVNCDFYNVFCGDSFDIDSFEKTCMEVMERQGKVLALINDPCHNPTGYSMTGQEWEKVMAAINKISQKGPFILINDIAYIDYAYSGKHSRDYMKNFENMGENVMVVVAFSTSKTLTSYGLRCGASVALSKNREGLRDFVTVAEKGARASWSNIPNAAMDNFVKVVGECRDRFEKEKQYYVDLLKKRSEAFLSSAEKADLPCYPYKEGFFVTVKIDEEKRKDYHEKLMGNNIFTVLVTGGIRVAICSLPLDKCRGLARKMGEIYHDLNKG